MQQLIILKMSNFTEPIKREKDEEKLADKKVIRTTECELCDNKFPEVDAIDLHRETEYHHEDWILCPSCFHERVDVLREELWNVDDYMYESTSSDENDVENTGEEEGIGCNQCYSCVTGGSGPCVLDKYIKECLNEIK